MYQLPIGEQKLAEDVAFQVQGKEWGKSPKGDTLQVKIFPHDWTHAVSAQSPKRIVHLYRGSDRAVFIRYIGKSLRDPLLAGFNERLEYLAGKWHTELVSRDFFIPPEPKVALVTGIDSLDLRVEQQAIRRIVLEAVRRFASEQQVPGGDLYGLSVTGIICWFDIENGHFSVHFDVRAPFEIDGAYSHEEFASLPRENWRQVFERFCDGAQVTLTGLTGKVVKIKPGNDFNFEEAFGLILVDLVKTMQAEKAFAALLLVSDAELIIEAHDAGFAWPSSFEDRGKENRLRQ